MKQQINLYQPIFRKQKKVFSAVAMLQVSAIALVMFMLTGGYSYLQLNRLKQQETVAANNLFRIHQQIEELEAKSKDNTTSKLLEAEINRITREIEQKKNVASLLTKGSFANTAGFSGYFEAIARQHVSGTWLTTITIGDGGSILNMRGITYSAELVPVYLQRLLQEEVFTGASFNVLGMVRSANNPEEISFHAGTNNRGNSNGSS